MIILEGKSVCSGIAFGTIQYYNKQRQQVRRLHIEDTSQELDRLQQAKDRTLEELNRLYEKALHEAGEANAEIFHIHAMMLEDDDYSDSITAMIRTQKVKAEYAVSVTGDNFSKMFEQMDDAYMKGRAADVKDISERLLNVLSGLTQTGIATQVPVILAADDLAPSETVQLDKSKIMAFLTRHGSANSHTAILARTMNIPAIIGLGETIGPEHDGMGAIVDGFNGRVYLEPDAETSETLKKRYEADMEQKKLMEQLKGKDNVTLDGQHIQLFANIGSPEDLGKVLVGDAGGIGLFRSEFLYLQKNDYPTEQEQFLAYKSVVETMGGKQVIIRTLDIGADKQADYFQLEHEANPALGYRAIRICLTRPELFKTQLRALLRASAYGNLAIMFPMIISVGEIRQIKAIVDEIKTELTEQHTSFAANVPLGIMVETPAAALMSDELAREVDFFSIGTNDLTQYTLAIDRENQKLEGFYDPHHPAVLRLIQMVVDNAHRNGIWAGICGELGADTTLTQTFLAMGVDELSVSPSAVLRLRKIVRETDVSKNKDSASGYQSFQ